jgi:phosphatidylglycerophosphate synthase
MTTYALVSENSKVRLWGLDSTQRLQRQLKQIARESPRLAADIRWAGDPTDIPEDGEVLLLNGAFLFEVRTLKGVLERPGCALLHEEGSLAAAFTDAAQIRSVLARMRGTSRELPQDLRAIGPADMAAFDESLRRSTRPLLEPIGYESKAALENLLYGNAYRGITDLVTKFLWPKPARRLVRLCAALHLSPNMVTTLGLALVVAACFLFLDGHYGWGLLAGWIMTLLDTVDGKLARVTVQSSRFGHYFDHLIDLFHPPFWYVCWGLSLEGFTPVFGLDIAGLSWLIVIAYIAGRAVEGLFPLLGNCSVFTWRPFDAWFRLVTARRNPCLILLTAALLAGRPDWGFVAVALWSALTSLMLVVRLAQGVIARARNGPLESWLSAHDVATGPHARAYAVFGATRGAYVHGE